MRLPGFEPGSSGPKPERLAKLSHNPIVLCVILYNLMIEYVMQLNINGDVFNRPRRN